MAKARRVDLRVTSADLRRWRAAAKADGRTLSDWIRRRCFEAARETLLPDARSVGNDDGSNR